MNSTAAIPCNVFPGSQNLSVRCGVNKQRESGRKDGNTCFTGIKFQIVKILSGIVSSEEIDTVLERIFYFLMTRLVK